VECRKASRPTTVNTVREPRKIDRLGGAIGFEANTAFHSIQGGTIRAEIIGSDQCSAEGYSVRHSAPILALCRRLVEAGFNPGLPLNAYRGDILCIIARTIGEAAEIDINGHGTGFIKRPKEGGRAPAMRPNWRGLA
jgi:hypothetical protein